MQPIFFKQGTKIWAGLGFFLFARRYWGNSLRSRILKSEDWLFSFPPLTEMFHFSGFAP